MNGSRKYLGIIGMVLVLVALAGCGPKKPDTIDIPDLVGHWEILGGDETEVLDLAADGSFTGMILRDGFMATTLSQGPRVSVEGDWGLDGHTITFDLTSSSEQALVGQSNTYKILKLTDRDMSTLDARGKKKTLLRRK